jgi:cellulose synthase operon protein C
MSTATPEIDEVSLPCSSAARSIGFDYESIKPFLDFSLALPLFVISTPIILICMALVKFTSRGPAIYTQKRLGLAGRIFTIYKIRTMYEDSEHGCGARWSLPGDPRVTPVGRFLRFCHLDELPQLVNILWGEMSVVGPRPERPELAGQLERALPRYRERLAVRPGLTGLAQVQQPPDSDLVSVSRKLGYDLCYVDRMNPWLDFRIILGTVLKCLGVPFVWIGRLMRFPGPDAAPVRESLLVEGELAANSIVPAFLALGQPSQVQVAQEPELAGDPPPRKKSPPEPQEQPVRSRGGSRRTLRLGVLAMIVIVVAVFIGGGYAAHEVQVWRHASELLKHAERAEAEHLLPKAEKALRDYLRIRYDDRPTWIWYARVMRDQQTVDLKRKERIFSVHEEALRYNADDSQLERRCADLALEIGRYNDARRHLANLLKPGPASDTERAELEDLSGQCEQGATQYELAEDFYERAIQHDPHRVACYDRLALLRRLDLRRNKPADDAIKAMIATNPASGLAYVYRWRYADRFAPPADPNDIEKALKLAPNPVGMFVLPLVLGDPEVLLAAAAASERKREVAAARKHYEAGVKLDPKNVALVLGLARLETGLGHIDRAEAVLRQGFEAKPTVGVAFLLADNLIQQGKLEGFEGAARYMGRLRSVGLGDTWVRVLEAKILIRDKKWAKAIAEIDVARVLLASEPEHAATLDVMLAECYRHVGDDEQRLDALRQAAERSKTPDSARAEFSQALARSGQMDEAITVLRPIADHRPEWRLDLVDLLLKRAVRQPKDRRNWPEVEQALKEAEQALPDSVESLTLLRVKLLTAQGRLDDARSFLSPILAKNPRNLRYRLMLAELTQRQGKGALAVQVLDLAEKDLGKSPELDRARLDYWGLEGGDAAKAAVAKLASARDQIAAAERPAFLDRLAMAEIRLGQIEPARQYLRELADLNPQDIGVRLNLIDLAVVAGDHDAAGRLVDEIKKTEDESGTNWRFARALLLIDKVRRGNSENLAAARQLAADISKRRPRWANGFALRGAIAELDHSAEEAIDDYMKAVELGFVRPSVIHRLVGLLNDQKRVDDINRVSKMLRDQGAALDEITMVRALDAIDKREFDQGIALARQVFPETSTSSSDHLMMGRIYMTAGQADVAGKEFQRAVELGPGVPESWMTFVQFLVQAKQLDRARAAVEAARKALPADRSTLTLAQCCLFVGDAKQARELAQKAMDEGKSADPSALQIAASAALSLNQLDEVNKHLDKLELVAPAGSREKLWANRIRSTLLSRTGRPADRERALKLADQNLRIDPSSIEDQALKATILASSPAGRAEAIGLLEQPNFANRLSDKERFLLAQLYLGERNEEKYRFEMQKLVGQKAKNPLHLAHFIEYWISRNQLDQADRWLSELKTAEPQGFATLALEARLLDLRKRKPEILALLEARGRQFPDQIGSVAELLDRYGFPSEAEAAYRAFVAREPAKPERTLALAQFLARRDRIPEAMEILRKAWSQCPLDRVVSAAVLVYDAPSAGEDARRQVEAWVTEAAARKPDALWLKTSLGAIWIHTGRLAEAESLYRKILGSDPNDALALNNLAWLLAMRDSKHFDEALNLINKAVELQGPAGMLVSTRAVVLIRAGRLDEAVDQLTSALRRSPDKSNLAAYLAWALSAKGHTAEARKQFLKAEELGLSRLVLDPLERAVIQKLKKELFPA